MIYLRNESLQHILKRQPVPFCLLPVEDLSQPPEPGHRLVLRKIAFDNQQNISLMFKNILKIQDFDLAKKL